MRTLHKKKYTKKPSMSFGVIIALYFLRIFLIFSSFVCAREKSICNRATRCWKQFYRRHHHHHRRTMKNCFKFIVKKKFLQLYMAGVVLIDLMKLMVLPLKSAQIFDCLEIQCEQSRKLRNLILKKKILLHCNYFHHRLRLSSSVVKGEASLH